MTSAGHSVSAVESPRSRMYTRPLKKDNFPIVRDSCGEQRSRLLPFANPRYVRSQVIELRQGSREDLQGEGREWNASFMSAFCSEGPPLVQTFYPSLMTR